LLLAAAQNYPQQRRLHKAQHNKSKPGSERSHRHQRRVVGVALADVNGQAKQLLHVVDRGQTDEKDNKIKEKELKQQRRVAHQVDVPFGDVADEPVARKAGNAGEGAQNSGEDDAVNRYFGGVQNTNANGAPERIGVGIVANNRLANGELGINAEEVEGAA